jgi:chromosome segregation ATPase
MKEQVKKPKIDLEKENLKKENAILERRLQHLFKSKTIKEYDEVDEETKLYKFRPEDLDRYIEKLKGSIEDFTTTLESAKEIIRKLENENMGLAGENQKMATTIRILAKMLED